MNLKRSNRGRKPNFTDDQLVRVMVLKSEGLGNKEIFHKVSKEFGLTFSISYYTKATSHFWRLKEQVDRRVKSGDRDLADKLQSHNLIIDEG